MKHKVGDKVKIRTDLVPDTMYGTGRFIENMMQYCGREATIKHVWSNDYALDGIDWYWTDEMFEEKHVPKFKVGDKVRVRKDLKIGEKYNGLILRDEMYRHHHDDIMTIDCIDNDTCQCEESSFWWGEDMLEKKVEEEKSVVMTVEDLLNKTNVEMGSLIIAISYPNANFQTTIGHNKINRNSELYKRFIKEYGDMIVDEVSFDVTSDNYRVMKIKVDYAD